MASVHYFINLIKILICLFGFYLNLIGSSAILSIISLVYAYLGLQGSTFFVPNRIMCIKYALTSEFSLNEVFDLALAAVILRLSHTAIRDLVTVCIKLLLKALVVIAYQNQEDNGLSSSPKKKYEK